MLDDALRCLAEHLSSSPLESIKKRLTAILAWKKKAIELRAEDEALFGKMTSGCRSVLKGKRISLVRNIAAEIGWPDMSLFDEISDGFKLTGVQAKSGVFEDDCKPPLHSEEELMARGKFYDRHFGERFNPSHFRIFHNLFGDNHGRGKRERVAQGSTYVR